MKYEVGDLVYISDIRSLYRITAIHEKDKKYSINWIGGGDKNVPQRNPADESIFILHKKPSKLEKALL